MHRLSSNDATLAASRPAVGLTSTVVALWTALLRRHRQRRTIRALQGLDDRTLKDIGIYRSEIHSVALTCGAGRRVLYTYDR